MKKHKNSTIPEDKELSVIARTAQAIFVSCVFILVFLTLTYVMRSSINNRITSSPEYVFYANIGLLTFLAIFYSLTISDKYTAKLAALHKKIKDRITLLLKRKPTSQNITEQLSELKNIQDRIENNKFALFVSKLDYVVYTNALLFMFGVFLQAILGFYILSAFLLISGFVMLIYVLSVWAFIYQRKL